MPFFGLLLNSAMPSCHFSLAALFLLKASPAAAEPSTGGAPAPLALEATDALGVVVL
jgi:hypothetical protein